MADEIMPDAVPLARAPDDETASLKPLLVFPGLVPPGWKEALYDESAQEPSFMHYEHLLQTDASLRHLYRQLRELRIQAESAATEDTQDKVAVEQELARRVRLVLARCEELRQISQRTDAG